MTIYYEDEAEAGFPFEGEETAKKVIEAALDHVACPYEAQVSLTVTTREEIQKINLAQRGIDAATDVLSFPMTQYPAPGEFDFLEGSDDAFDPESGELLLGDIVISAPAVFSQAEAYGHSVLREYAFLIAHSVLHLVGYDHMEPGEAKVMEKTQEEILQGLGIQR